LLAKKAEDLRLLPNRQFLEFVDYVGCAHGRNLAVGMTSDKPGPFPAMALCFVAARRDASEAGPRDALAPEKCQAS
jgi:hypothetical protein